SYIAHVAGRVLGGDAAVMPLFTPVSFDLTLTTIFAPLCTGGRLHVVPEGPPEQVLTEAFSAEVGAPAVKLTPSHLSLLATLPAAPSRVRTAIVGGEALAPSQVHTLVRRCPGIRVVNEYGPTEATIGAVAGEVDAHDVHIGRPYPNVRAYVLDAAL